MKEEDFLAAAGTTAAAGASAASPCFFLRFRLWISAEEDQSLPELLLGGFGEVTDADVDACVQDRFGSERI